MPFECPQEVIDDFEKLFENEEEYDVIIYAGENENVKEIHAHSLILRTRSQYFYAAFSKKWSEKKNGKFIFRKPNISPQIFKLILRFIYCGKIDLEKLQGPDILKLLNAVDEINIETLTKYIQEYLTEHQDEFLQQNPIEIFEAVYQNESFPILWDLYLEKICDNPEILFNSDKFITLKAPLLELLFKRDDLSLDEIVIWDNSIKWCFAQHSNVSQDPEQWNKDEITIMERTIQRFIPLIRFNHISSEDFIIKVYPFKEIIPKELVKNTLTYHMAPNKQLNVNLQPPRQRKYINDSILLRSQHFAIFSSWIEKKNDFHYNVRNIPYNFNLLYRASRDGNLAENFHSICDNKGASIVIVKISNSEQIVGGYNPLYWHSGYSNGANSVCGFASNGPAFGGNSGCHLATAGRSGYIWSSDASINNTAFPEIGIPKNDFDVDDYEVFQVVKK
ncbi:hypothetical protein GLOIN_2v1838245 [Rhizophagus irregularis DAOM 181602=DAOM 197198]|nr:hypothetical protein GLOIN_2v1838245 [Rhizophagus irregularis DAOM 181602=DAOM 197198]